MKYLLILLLIVIGSCTNRISECGTVTEKFRTWDKYGDPEHYIVVKFENNDYEEMLTGSVFYNKTKIGDKYCH